VECKSLSVRALLSRTLRQPWAHFGERPLQLRLILAPEALELAEIQLRCADYAFKLPLLSLGVPLRPSVLLLAPAPDAFVVLFHDLTVQTPKACGGICET
jgi:hypothetical protein